jgi:uroporphyrinogen-III synthase
VQAFLGLRSAEGAPVPVPAHVVCIGPTTAAAARAAGMEGVHEAWGSSAEGIVAELAGHFGAAAGLAPGGASGSAPGVAPGGAPGGAS